MTSSKRLAMMGTSPRAIRHHYDLSDDFFRIWLGPDMVYSCGWWEAGDDRDSLAAAEIITDVEIRAGIELPMSVLRGLSELRTVGEVAAHLEAGAGRPPAFSGP